MSKLIVYTHSDCLLKDNGSRHPENKERLLVILKSIQDINSINIEIKDAPNPMNSPYRMIDGKHRMMKFKLKNINIEILKIRKMINKINN